MEKKYISESRYKKNSNKKRRDIKNVRNNINKAKDSVPKVDNEKKVKQKKVKLKVKRNKKNNSRVKNIIVCIILLLLIAIITRAILKEENEPFIPITFGEEANNEQIVIGIITEDDLLDENANNVVIQELNNYISDMLIVINDDYTIKYNLLSNIEKISNKEYILTVNEKYTTNLDVIKNTLEQYSKNTNSVFFSKLNNITSISVDKENTLKVNLKNDDPYFIYNLNIPIKLNKKNSMKNYELDSTSSSSTVIYNRTKNAKDTLPYKIIVKKYKDMYKAVEAYKKGDINIFITNAENTENIIGKYEYNISSFRNGETTFLLLNNKSNILSREEVRKAVLYGIDRDEIIKNILSSKGDKIDLPYIYDVVKYKYDIYAAENLLLTNGYEKENKIYTKTDANSKVILKLSLIVNKEDAINISIANKIKSNLSAIGINVTVEKLSTDNMKKRVKNNDYDMMIAKVTLNDNPNISFIKENLFITEGVNKEINNVNMSDISDLPASILKLQNQLSNDVSCIGIYADTSYIIYSKDIIGLENSKFLKIFENFFN